jgi:excisionase family DNA binding protein
MNAQPSQTVSIKIVGEIIIQRGDLRQLFQTEFLQATPSVETAKMPQVETDGKLPRLAFTMRETAEILGVSYITVHRLIQRGLLKSSFACRHKMISKIEIERFLKETSRSVYEK